jgi:threonylcarbamoyladenosine tRNA methylthiotransferase MtaB
MPQVAPGVARERAARLREAAATRRAAWLATLVGSDQQIVIETPGDRGHTRAFAEVRLPHPMATIGDIATVRITAAADAHLIGIPA